MQRSSSGQHGRSLQTRRGESGFPSAYSGYGGGPFALMRRISDEMDRLFESFGMGGSAFPSSFGQSGSSQFGGGGQGMQSLWSPHIEVRQREGKLVVSADLPGVKKDDVKVEVNDDGIVLQGERRDERTSNESGYYHSERSYGSFYRVIPLPEGADAQSATASFREGVLEIEVPVPEQRSKGRQLEIKDVGSGSSTSESHGAGAASASGASSSSSPGSSSSSQNPGSSGSTSGGSPSTSH